MRLWHRKVARAFIFDTDKKLFLLVKSSMPPFTYHLPGGGIHRKESVEDAVKREIREELNITSANIASITFLHKKDTEVLFIPHEMDIFLVCVQNVDLKLSWEIVAYAWFTFDELKQALDKDSLFEVEKLSYLVS